MLTKQRLDRLARVVWLAMRRINRLHWKTQARSGCVKPASPTVLSTTITKNFISCSEYRKNMFARFSFSVDIPSNIMGYYSIRDSWGSLRKVLRRIQTVQEISNNDAERQALRQVKISPTNVQQDPTSTIRACNTKHLRPDKIMKVLVEEKHKAQRLCLHRE